MYSTTSALEPEMPVSVPRYWRAYGSLTARLSLGITRLRLADNTPLVLYEAGPPGAPDLVCVSPAESPFLLMAPLFMALSKTFRVIAFDHPGAPFMENASEHPLPTVGTMAATLVEVLRARAIQSAHIVTWCVGALVPIWALGQGCTSFRSLNLIAPPSLLGKCDKRTPFQKFFVSLLLQIASSPADNCAGLCNWIRRASDAWSVTCPTDELILKLSTLPVQEDESIRRYAMLTKWTCEQTPVGGKSLADAYAELMDTACAELPVTIFHCADDDIVSSDSSADIVNRNSRARLLVYPSGSHFVLFKEPDLLGRDIAASISALWPPVGHTG